MINDKRQINILVVDDDSITLRLLEQNIKKWDFTVYSEENGIKAWERLKSVPIDIVVSDWMMPEMNGLELCRRIRSTDSKRYIYFIIVSALNTQEEIVHGLEAGIDDYITKPINMEELRARINIGVRIVNLEKELTGKYQVIEKNYFQTIRMFGNIMEAFNEDLGGHSRRTAKLSLQLAKRHPGVSEKDYPVIEAAGQLIDIGMVVLPNEFLSKKRTELSGDEKQLYLSHPVLGETILNEIEFLRPVAQLVRAHHEQFNGKGFPDGLKEDEIPLVAQIISAASIYDNLIHKGKFSFKDLPEHLQRMEGYQLSPHIIDHLLDFHLENIHAEEKKDYIEISLDDLEEGMILAKDIKRKTGALFMPINTEMTFYFIEKLKGFHKLGNISNHVPVYKKSL